MIRHLTDKSQHYQLKSKDFLATKVVLNKVLPKTFTHDIFSVLLLHKGQLHLKINQSDFSLSAGTLIIIPPGHVCEVFETNESIILYNCSYTSEYAIQNLLDTPQSRYFQRFIKNAPVLLRPSHEEIAAMLEAYKIVCRKPCAGKIAFEQEVLKLHFNLFICEFTAVYFQLNHEDTVRKNSNDAVVLQFMSLLRKHSKTQHSVQFYADALYMSAGHLTRIIKQAKNKTVKQLIEDALIAEAKQLLDQPEISMLQITEELDFASLSVFSSFFKKHTMFSPTHYRVKNLHA